MLTQERLKELLDYNPETGVFIWKQKPSPVVNRIRIGGIAGTRNKQGYRIIAIDKKHYLYHRLAFLFMTGHWPENQVDHINRNPSDNRWCNLRPATCQQNAWNRGAADAGIRQRGNRWHAEMRGRFLGSFKTREEALAVRAYWMEKLRGEFARRAA